MPIYSGGMQEREQTTELAKSPTFRTCRLVIGPVANSNSKSGHTVCNGERQSLLDLDVQPGQWLSVQTRNRLNFAASPGKIAKSLRNIFSSKVGGSFHPEPSYWPEIKIDRNFSLRCHSADIGNDGSGCIKPSAAYRLMKRGAARYFIHRGLLMLYFVPFAADHSGKGQYDVLPFADFPTTDSEGNPRPVDTNLVIAADNFNDRVRCPHSAITAFFLIYPAQFQEVPPLHAGAGAHDGKPSPAGGRQPHRGQRPPHRFRDRQGPCLSMLILPPHQGGGAGNSGGVAEAAGQQAEVAVAGAHGLFQ